MSCDNIDRSQYLSLTIYTGTNMYMNHAITGELILYFSPCLLTLILVVNVNKLIDMWHDSYTTIWTVHNLLSNLVMSIHRIYCSMLAAFFVWQNYCICTIIMLHGPYGLKISEINVYIYMCILLHNHCVYQNFTYTKHTYSIIPILPNCKKAPDWFPTLRLANQRPSHVESMYMFLCMLCSGQFSFPGSSSTLNLHQNGRASCQFTVLVNLTGELVFLHPLSQRYT